MYVGHFCSLHHFVHGDLSFIVTIHNVLRDGTIKKYGLLRDYFQLTSYVINVETFYIEDVQSLLKEEVCTVKLLMSEAKPSATQFFKRSYKISHNPGL